MRYKQLQAYASYPISIFLGAFLLFQIQPMIGRYLLPFFGGSVSVWGASLVFFTGMLFLGYAYVYVLHRLPMRRQVLIHGALLLIAKLFVLGVALFGGTLYLIPEWVFESGMPPTLQVLLVLAASIGLPYFVLSTTSPLLQHWYGTSGKEPYHLYALSNLGSLIALATFPFIIEPLFGLATQQLLWGALFIVYCVSCAAVTMMMRTARVGEQPSDAVASFVAPLTTQLAWLCLSLIPAAMLVATATHMSQTIAPAPFLWIVPLLLYLTSLVLAFRGWGGSGFVATAVVVAAYVAFSYSDHFTNKAVVEIVANTTLFFLGSLYCHAMLYQRRPPTQGLSYYYLVISLGGVIGTIFMSMVAPLLFIDFFEFAIGIGVFAAAAIFFFPAHVYLRDGQSLQEWIIKGCLILAIVYLLGAYSTPNEAVYTIRNFYGQARVRDHDGVRWFSHGTTLHGSQFLDEKGSRQATTYYAPGSGIARAISYEQSVRGKDGIDVGVLGLGAGSIAAHCRPNDRYTFYEIDPDIGAIAREYFTYLDNCEHSEVRFGDGRLLLEGEMKDGKAGKYDLLVVAAFSDDFIPMHLITKEAVALYLEHLRGPESILAIVTSSRYVKLTAATLRIAEELGVGAVYVYNASDSAPGALRSDWVLISPDQRTLQAPLIAEGVTYEPADAPLWTDDYVNLFGALRWPN